MVADNPPEVKMTNEPNTWREPDVVADDVRAFADYAEQIGCSKGMVRRLRRAAHDVDSVDTARQAARKKSA